MAKDLALPVVIIAVLMAVLAATSYKLLVASLVKHPDLAILAKGFPGLVLLVGALIIYRRIVAIVQPVSHRLAIYFKLAPEHREKLGYQHKVTSLTSWV